ncbi:hypothetical protein SPLC1_S130100 [Arthrospira platensis C1]|nr:hypothetical protein SPLC1_S130100 [Arthrospira platensis C1]
MSTDRPNFVPSTFLSFHQIFPRDSTNFPQGKASFSTDLSDFSTANHSQNDSLAFNWGFWQA